MITFTDINFTLLSKLLLPSNNYNYYVSYSLLIHIICQNSLGKHSKLIYNKIIALLKSLTCFLKNHINTQITHTRAGTTW